MSVLLDVRQLSIGFTQYFKGWHQRIVQPISDLTITINEGEIVAVVGASGSGKSLLAHAILGILPKNAICQGEMRYQGQPLTEQRKAQLRGKEITFIPQSVNHLDPLMRVGKQVRIGLPKQHASAQQRELFKKYGLKESDEKLFPHELSGGMLRRVMFATSVREGVKLVIADEPTPGIHPTALAEVLKQLQAFAEAGAGVMFITHDIMAARQVANRIAVMREGTVVEVAPTSAFSNEGEDLQTSYAKALWRALPQNEFSDGLGGDKSWL